ncbi:hypothetical protein ACSMXM_10730 [Pacificimonas sp. ICDLI1SI03]
MTTVAQLPASLLSKDTRQADLGLIGQNDEAKINQLGMGVLSDGTPFLTQRGLAALCGVENAHIGTISSQWDESNQKPRISKIKDIIYSHGQQLEKPHIELRVNGRVVFGYREEFCLAVLEYYAFEAGQYLQEEAIKHYRLLAGKGFREFIYGVVGYAPASDLDRRWQPFLDRVSRTYNSVPHGYFSIFREIADLVVTLGENGVYTSDKIVPDISVGLAWSAYWTKSKLENVYGPRKEYEHNYPDYFPQAVSNPQHPWCYPDSVLGKFREWFRDQYLYGGKFKRYLDGQVKAQRIGVSTRTAALESFTQQMLEGR